jgi:hypothetical protein
MKARILVRSIKLKKVVPNFNMASTHTSRVEGHILNKKAGVRM